MLECEQKDEEIKVTRGSVESMSKVVFALLIKHQYKNNSTLITSRHVFSVDDTADLYLKARTHRDEFRTRYSPTFNAS